MGIMVLTQALAVAGAKLGVRANAALPGHVDVKHECRQANLDQARNPNRL